MDVLTPGTMFLPDLGEGRVVWRGVPQVQPAGENSNPGSSQSKFAGVQGRDLVIKRANVKGAKGGLKAGEEEETKGPEIPLVPFSLLLLHKLQGWDDHRKAEEAHKRKKVPQDAADVRRLLGLDEWVRSIGDVAVAPEANAGDESQKKGRNARRKKKAKDPSKSAGEVNESPSAIGKAKPTLEWLSDRGVFCEEFEELTKRRVLDYCEEYPKAVTAWRAMGFEVPDPVPKPKGVAKGKEKTQDQEGREEGEEDRKVEEAEGQVEEDNGVSETEEEEEAKKEAGP